MPPLVSIIIPCYNDDEYLDDAIQSVLAQTYTNWECIVVNDGSTDETKDVVSKYVQQHNRISYFEKQNGGPSSARNKGINHAKGEFILPLDGDDKISANYVEECVRVISTSKTIKAVNGRGQKFGLMNGAWILPDFNREALLFQNILPPTSLYKKADWEKIGGYDEKMLDGCEDWEFWINLFKDGGEAVRADKAVFFWRRKEVSRTTSLNTVKLQRLQQYMYCKHAILYEPFFKDPIDLYQKYKGAKQDWDWANNNAFRFFISRLKKKSKKRLAGD